MSLPLLSGRNNQTPNSPNCRSAQYDILQGERGTVLLRLASCAQWGDVSRVYVDSEDGDGTSVGLDGLNTAVLPPERTTDGSIEISDIDKAIIEIGTKCCQICSNCNRWEKVQAGVGDSLDKHRLQTHLAVIRLRNGLDKPK